MYIIFGTQSKQKRQYGQYAGIEMKQDTNLMKSGSIVSK